MSDDVEMKDAPPAEAAADDAAMADDAPEMVLPMVDEKLLADVQAMGFPEVRARKALMSGKTNVEAALDWLLSHEGDADIDAPIPLVEKPKSLGAAAGGAPAVAKSIKCVETGRLFRNMAEAQAYANKTGRSNFEECTEEKKPLTEEEKKAKVAELKALAAARRAEREGVEKVEDVDREKKRREGGKEAIKTKEVLQKNQRLREIDRIKREKNAEKKERERLRAEIAKDKAERRARGGKLAGKLGVDGYAPSIDQDDARRDEGVPAGASDDGAAPPAAPARVDVKELAKGRVVSEGAPKAPALPPPEAVDKAIRTLAKYKTAGDGGVALKTLGAYVRNALNKGDQDPKFRTIPLDNAAFKKRVAGLVGGVALLRAVGFAKDEAAGTLVLAPETRDANKELLGATLGKLEAAYACYVEGKAW